MCYPQLCFALRRGAGIPARLEPLSSSVHAVICPWLQSTDLGSVLWGPIASATETDVGLHTQVHVSQFGRQVLMRTLATTQAGCVQPLTVFLAAVPLGPTLHIQRIGKQPRPRAVCRAPENKRELAGVCPASIAP